MTTGTPPDHGGGDVSRTLADLERKLRELERELSAGAPPSEAAPAAPPHVPPAAPAPPSYVLPAAPAPTSHVSPATPAPASDADRLVADARARLGALPGQVDELLRFREQLQRTARELDDELGRVLARIGGARTP